MHVEHAHLHDAYTHTYMHAHPRVYMGEVSEMTHTIQSFPHELCTHGWKV